MENNQQEKPVGTGRSLIRLRLAKFVEKHPRIMAVWKNNLVWGIGFSILIVVLLLPIDSTGLQRYELDSIVNETIVARQNYRVPDREATRKKRDERLAAVKSIYTYNDSQWQNYIGELDKVFGIGNSILYQEPIDPDHPVEEKDFNKLSADDTLLEQIRTELEGKTTLPTNPAVIKEFVRNGFSRDFQQKLETIIKTVMEQPIIITNDSPRPAGYVLRPLSDSTKTNKTLLRLEEARQLIDGLVAEELGNIPPVRRTAIINWLKGVVEPTAILDRQAVLRQVQEAEAVETLYYEIKRGEVIAREGDRITDEDTLAKINYVLAFKARGFNYFNYSISLSFFTILFLYALNKFSFLHKQRRKVSYRLFILLSLTLITNLAFIKLVKVIGDSFGSALTAPILQNVQHYYWAIPFALGAMLVTLLVGTQIAASYSIVLVFLAGFLFSDSFEIMLYAIIGNFVAIYGVRQYKERTALIKSGIAVGLINIITISAIFILNNQVISPAELMFALSLGMAGGLLSSLIASFIVPILESLFKITTDFRLLELSNHEHPLLRSLFINAPGTFQHSIVVGYLAEAAANSIGANALFCRVACLYHDIGKMVKPKYYVENTSDLGKRHEQLSPHMSALVIINHVKEGIELGRSYHLPQSLIDIIPQHHGTKLIKFFYDKARSNQKPGDVPIKEEEFRYPGPKPQTREAGIIMIADGVEAAARSLSDPSPGRLKGTIRAMIDSIFLDGQLDECDLTLKDLTKISEAFLKVLISMKHERIKYPGFPLEKRRAKKGSKPGKEVEEVETATEPVSAGNPVRTKNKKRNKAVKEDRDSKGETLH